MHSIFFVPQYCVFLGDLAAETAGGNFIPHVARVDPGEVSLDIILLVFLYANFAANTCLVCSFCLAFI